MKDTKLLRYYRTFSVEEAKEWLTFVQSPYFNTNPNVVSLAKILRSYYPNFDHKGLAKEKVYRRIYGKETYQDIKMRKLMSAGVKLVERYWVVKETVNDELIYKRQLSKGLRQRDLFVDYQKSMHNLIKEHELRAKTNPASYYDLHQLNWDLAADRQFLKGIVFQKQLRQASDHMNQYSQTQHLLHFLVWYDMSKMQSIDIPSYLIKLKEISNYKAQSPSENILILIKDVITQDTSNDQLFEKAQLYISDQFASITKNILYISYRLLLNYLMVLRRNGIDANDRYIRLLQEGVRHNAFIYRGKVSIAIFINQTIELAEQKLFSQAREFIKSTEDLLFGQQTNEIVQLAHAYILFYENNYFESYSLVSSFYFTGHTELENVRRTVQLRSALSSDKVNSEGMLAIANAFEKYIRGNKLTAPTKKNTYLQLIKFVRRIQSLKDKGKPEGSAKSQLNSEINQSKALNPSILQWLLSELE